MNTQFIKGALVAIALALLSSMPARAQNHAAYPDGTVLIYHSMLGDSSVEVRHVIQGGAKFWLSYPDEWNIFDSPNTYTVSEAEVEAITPYPRDGTVVQARGDAAVYVIFGGRKWHIPDMQELEYYGGVGAIRTLPMYSFNSNSMYRAFSGTLVREHNTAEVYVIYGNARFWVPSSQEVEYYGGWSKVRDVPKGTMSSVRTAPECGTRLRERSTGDIYIFNLAGQKSLIQNPTAYDWANHYVVPDGSLASFPNGTFVCLN